MCVSDSGKDLALVQILRKKILFLGALIRINRGPIFINEDLGEEFQCEVIKCILNELRKDSLLVQIAPEISQSAVSELMFKNLGFKRLSNTPWSSGKLDLSFSEEEILMSLNGKWRNCYRKGKKLGVEVSNVSDSPQELAVLLSHYENLQTKKDFSGLTNDLLISMANKNHPLWNFNVFKAQDKNEILLGYLITVEHGETSIYLIGLTTDEGRRLQANYVMLWEGILNAKNAGCLKFDIGGLSSDTPKGVAHFKNGLKSEMYSLIGEWRRLYLLNIIKF